MRKNGCSKNPNEQRTVKNEENDERKKLGGSQSVLAANTEPFSILVSVLPSASDRFGKLDHFSRTRARTHALVQDKHPPNCQAPLQ